MKKVLAAVVLLVGGLLGYNLLTTGQLNVVPGVARSAEARELQDLASRFDAARGRMLQAQRAAGVTGMDTTADADAALREASSVRKDLAKLMPRLASEKDRSEAQALDARIREFQKDPS